MKQNFKAGDEIEVKILDQWKKFEVVSFCSDWIAFKNPDGKNFTLGIKIHKNHIKFPEAVIPEITSKKKRGRRKKK